MNGGLRNRADIDEDLRRVAQVTTSDSRFFRRLAADVPPLLAALEQATSENVDLRAKLHDGDAAWREQVARGEEHAAAARAARAELAQLRAALEDAFGKLEQSGEHITEPWLHGLEDNLVRLTVAALRTVVRTAVPDTGPTQTEQQP